MAKSKITKHLREKATASVLEDDWNDIPTFTTNNQCHVIAIVNPPTNRRMDSPNWYPTVKALIDGLSDAGVFADDNDKVISSVTFVPGVKTTDKKYRIDLHIKEGILNTEGV